MKHKFEVGDVVKMNEKANGRYTFTTTSKVKEAVVIGYSRGEVSIKITKGCSALIGDSYCVNAECIDLVRKAKQETIVIYRNGQKVIALDKSTGKKAEAKCNSDDEFDFHVGAKLAFQRLMDEKTATEGEVREVKRAAKVGEYIKITNPVCVPVGEDGKSYYKKGDVLKVIGLAMPFGYPRIAEGTDKFGRNFVVAHPEYVVLENYKPKEEPKKKGKICVGDTVKVVDIGRQFSTYYTWSGLEGYRQNFVNGSFINTEDNFKVLVIKKHDTDDSKTVALIQNPKTTQVFIINVEGLEKVER